jgi:hypothetical protein
MQEIKEISNSEPLHIGQNKINRALFDYLNEKFDHKNNLEKLVEFKFDSEFKYMTKLSPAGIKNKDNQIENYFYEV